MEGMRRLPAAVALSLSLAACATGNSGSDDTDTPDASGNPDDPDAPPGTIDAPPGTIDAPPGIDAMPQAVTLSQNTSMAITSPNTLACASSDSVAPDPDYTLENHFYRAFRLMDHGISGQFTATRVDLGIEQAETVAGQQTITVRLHTVAGMFPGGALTQLHTQSVVVTDVTSTLLPINLSSPVVVPASSELVLEIVGPAHAAANNFFFPGSNSAGETKDSYIAAADCGIGTPVTYSTVDGTSVVHLVMTVSGTAP
jgi:hypothetical protein